MKHTRTIEFLKHYLSDAAIKEMLEERGGFRIGDIQESVFPLPGGASIDDFMAELKVALRDDAIEDEKEREHGGEGGDLR